MKKIFLLIAVFIILNSSFLIHNCFSQWVQMSSGMGNDITVLSFAISGNNIFAGTHDYPYPYGVYLSTNNGQNWTQTNLKNKTVKCIAISGNNIFAGCYYNQGIYLSTNNGQNWMQTALNNQFVMSLAINGNNIFAGKENYPSGSGGVSLTTNNGQNWIEKNQGFNPIPTVYTFLIANNYIFAGTGGQSVWRRSLSEIIGIKNISTEVPEEFELRQNYPNPFNTNTIIRFQISMDSHLRRNDKVVLRVFDLMGREVATLVNEKLQPGIYSVRFDAGDLPSGIYFYRMEAGSFTETRKLILLK